jgi:outer membrane protein assembly factor BamB
MTQQGKFFFMATLCSLVLFVWTANADESWPQFRGPGGIGMAPESAQPPVKWDLKKNVVWESEIPGVGWSSPVYADGKIWLTTAITTEASQESIEKKREEVGDTQIKTVAASVEFRAVCVDLETGNVLHDIALDKVDNPELINPLNSYASPTVAIEDGFAVCHFGSYGTWCLDSVTAEAKWKQRFVVDHSVGPGSSPVIYNGNVILVCDGIDRQYVVAVDLKSGEEVWRTSRPPMRSPNNEHHKAYSTPLIEMIDGRPQAIIPCAQWIVSYDPNSGEELWRADHGDGFSVVPMAIYESGLIVFSTSFPNPEFVAVDPSGSGDVTETHIKWRARNAPKMSSFIAIGGRLYAVTDRGILSTNDMATGQEINKGRVGGNFSASPIFAAGNLYLSSREGVVSVVQCSDSLEEVASNKFESPLLASPGVVGNDLLIRTENKLYRIKN